MRQSFTARDRIRLEVLLQFLGVVQAAVTSMAFPTQTLHLSPQEVRGPAASSAGQLR